MTSLGSGDKAPWLHSGLVRCPKEQSGLCRSGTLAVRKATLLYPHSQAAKAPLPWKVAPRHHAPERGPPRPRALGLQTFGGRRLQSAFDHH